MKVLYIAIITALGIGGGIYLVFSHASLYPLNIPSPSQTSYTTFDAEGLQNVYTVGDAANFTISIRGHGTFPCVTPGVKIYNDMTPSSPILDVKSGDTLCQAMQGGDFGFYFPSKTGSYSAALDRAGNYTLEISYGKRTTLDSFTVLPTAATINTIKIADLQKKYSVHQAINATVDYSGYYWYTEPEVKIIDANGTQVWFNCPFCYTRTEASVSPSLDNFTYYVRDYATNRLPVINKTGTYTMFASLDNKSTEANFSVISNQTPPYKLEIDLANQTYEAGYPVDVNLRNVNQDYGCRIPSVSVLDASNQSLVFGPTPERDYGHGHCADPWNITFYAGLENNSLVTKPTIYEIVATLDNMTYQKEFTAMPSNYSGIDISSGSSHTLPGFLTYSSCLPIPSMPPNNGTLVSYSGFSLYHRYLAGPDTGGLEFDDYLLRPGETGYFVMQVHQGQFLPGHNLAGGLSFLSGNLLNVDNSTVWKSDRPVASEGHPGLEVSYSPSIAVAGPDGYATITVSISARQDAPTGSYWLYLPPGECGGDRVLLTVGNKPLAQPPDYIGYDFDSSFVVDSAGNLVFELINPGIHTIENCSLNYVSNNQTTTIKTFRIIAPGMEFKHVWNTTSNPIDKRLLQCTTPPITKIYPNEVIDGLPW